MCNVTLEVFIQSWASLSFQCYRVIAMLSRELCSNDMTWYLATLPPISPIHTQRWTPGQAKLANGWVSQAKPPSQAFGKVSSRQPNQAKSSSRQKSTGEVVKSQAAAALWLKPCGRPRDNSNSSLNSWKVWHFVSIKKKRTISSAFSRLQLYIQLKGRSFFSLFPQWRQKKLGWKKGRTSILIMDQFSFPFSARW